MAEPPAAGEPVNQFAEERVLDQARDGHGSAEVGGVEGLGTFLVPARDKVVRPLWRYQLESGSAIARSIRYSSRVVTRRAVIRPISAGKLGL